MLTIVNTFYVPQSPSSVRPTIYCLSHVIWWQNTQTEISCKKSVSSEDKKAENSRFGQVAADYYTVLAADIFQVLTRCTVLSTRTWHVSLHVTSRSLFTHAWRHAHNPFCTRIPLATCHITRSTSHKPLSNRDLTLSTRHTHTSLPLTQPKSHWVAG